MSEKNANRISLPIIIIACLLSLAAIVCSIVSCAQLPTVSKFFVCFIEIIVALSAIFYFSYGYSKDMNKYFKMFFIMIVIAFLIEKFLTILYPGEIKSSVDTEWWLIFDLICYGDMLLLGVGKNVGKAASLFLVSLNIVVYLIEFVLYLLPVVNNTSDVAVPCFIGGIVWLLLSLVAFIMVLAKYSDKLARKGKKLEK